MAESYKYSSGVGAQKQTEFASWLVSIVLSVLDIFIFFFPAFVIFTYPVFTQWCIMCACHQSTQYTSVTPHCFIFKM